ncbi:luciferin 4-monooxygenase-like [Phlebotomus argentipes]|uniref:luciferin 4-monooxygenase-like n=1 Tax=Phlebotomus argentipes TaxID=94469 RepID=UPI002892E66F|nr:luciferin 4-monooxygenase-like [Phlebotomus argentipes]
MNSLFKSTEFDEKSKIWKGGCIPRMFDPKISVGKAALFILNQNPDFVAQINDNSGIQKTNREIHDCVVNIAVNLRKLGCSKGDVVGFISRNNEFIGPAVLAAFLLAAPVNSLDTMFSKDEIIHMYSITQPKFIFCESDKVPVLTEALKVLQCNAKIIVFGERIDDLLHITDILKNSEPLEDFVFPDVDEHTCAVIICSSGTTGLPKGVSLTHNHILYMGSYGFTDELEKPCSMICYSSLYWYSGLVTLAISSLTSVTRIITTDPFSPELFYNMIMRYRPRILFTGPIQLSAILNHPLLNEQTMDCVQYYTCVGSIVPQSLWEKAKHYLPNGEIYNGYGMSEVGFVSREPQKTPRYSVGKLIAGIHVKIIDESGKRLGIGERGELCFKTDIMFLCYYNNPEQTAKALDEDGWIHSGDLGYFDEDGLLHIIGRNKDILKYNNYVVSPAEVENMILTIPGVLQAVVVGVSHPVSIDLPAAAVVRKNDATVTEQEILTVIENKLSDAKRLRGGVYFVDSVPLTPSGKVKKNLVKEIVEKLYREKNH